MSAHQDQASEPTMSRLHDLSALRARSVLARASNGQPRTYRLAPIRSKHAAYRHLAVAILGLDVATLASELRAIRRSVLPHAA
jgi:hypothetical protein